MRRRAVSGLGAVWFSTTHCSAGRCLVGYRARLSADAFPGAACRLRVGPPATSIEEPSRGERLRQLVPRRVAVRTQQMRELLAVLHHPAAERRVAPRLVQRHEARVKGIMPRGHIERLLSCWVCRDTAAAGFQQPATVDQMHPEAVREHTRCRAWLLPLREPCRSRRQARRALPMALPTPFAGREPCL